MDFGVNDPLSWASRGAFDVQKPAWQKAPDYTNPNWSYSSGSGYTTNPGPRSGQGAFGMVPGVVTQPPNIWHQMLSADPELRNVVRNVTGFLDDESAGQLSAETLATLQDQSAVYGQTNGLNLSDFAGHQGLRRLGVNVEKTQQQAVADTIKWMEMMGKYQDDPALAAAIAAWNATNSAAPDPTAAYNQMMRDFRNGLGLGAGGGGGVHYSPAGGTTRNYSSDPFSAFGPATGTIYNGVLYNEGTSPVGLEDRWAAANPWANPQVNSFLQGGPFGGLGDLSEDELLGMYDLGLLTGDPNTGTLETTF